MSVNLTGKVNTVVNVPIYVQVQINNYIVAHKSWWSLSQIKYTHLVL